MARRAQQSIIPASAFSTPWGSPSAGTLHGLVPFTYSYLADDLVAGVADGGEVTTWGSGSTALNLTGAGTAKPLLTHAVASINNQPGVLFDATDDAMTTATVTAVAQPFSVVTVARLNTAGATRELVSGLAGTLKYLSTSTTAWRVRNGGTAASAGTNDTTARLFVTVCRSNDDTIYTGAGQSLVSGDTGSTSWSAFTLGYVTVPGDCYISFVGLYAGDVTAHRNWSLWRYLAGVKWAV